MKMQERAGIQYMAMRLNKMHRLRIFQLFPSFLLEVDDYLTKQH